MTDLWRADLTRLWKNKVFWGCLIAVVALEMFIVCNGCRQAAMDTGSYGYALDDFYFKAMPLLGLFAALVIGLFLGTEYSDGTLRNKLVVGHTRREVYLAHLLTGVGVTALLTVACFLAGAVGIPQLGFWKMGGGSLALSLLMALGFGTVLAALYTMVGMLSEKKSTTAVATLLLFLALIAFSTWLYARLAEPEMNTGIIITAQGMEWGDPTPNPMYIGGAMREFCRLLMETLPTGQAVLLANGELTRPALSLGASAALTVIFTAAGMALFEKKDLK